MGMILGFPFLLLHAFIDFLCLGSYSLEKLFNSWLFIAIGVRYFGPHLALAQHIKVLLQLLHDFLHVIFQQGISSSDLDHQPAAVSLKPFIGSLGFQDMFLKTFPGQLWRLCSFLTGRCC